MGISSPSLLTPYSSLLTTPPDLNLPLPLSFSFLFHPRRKEITSSSTTGEGRSLRAPPPAKGDHVELHRHREVPDQVRPHRIWWDLAGSGENSPVLAGFWPDLTGFAAAPPSTSPVLSNLYLLIFCFVLFFFLCGCYGEFFVTVIWWCLLLGWFSMFVVVTAKSRETQP
jgi:hypothetical protein